MSARAAAATVAVALGAVLAARAEESRPLVFAWPAPAEATVELTDYRSVGDDARTIVMTMRLAVRADAGTGRLVVSISGGRLVSIDGTTPGETDPAHVLLASGRLMKAFAPAMIVAADGGFVGLADPDRIAAEMLAAMGAPRAPAGSRAVADVFEQVAREDWNAWAGAWVGMTVTSGEDPGRVRLDATAVRDSDAVRASTAGFLIDMAREAQELGDDPATSEKFLASARYSPVTETLRVELDPATMRPFVAVRERTFHAVSGRHRVDGVMRRTHRFAWTADDAGGGAKMPR